MFDFSDESVILRGPAGLIVTLRHNLPFTQNTDHGLILTPALTVTLTFIVCVTLNIAVYLLLSTLSTLKKPKCMQYFGKASLADRIDCMTRFVI